MRTPTMEELDWSGYRATGDLDARNRLVERHLPLVHHFSQRVFSQTGGRADIEELVSAGVVGLMESIGSFEPARGYRFSTHAAPRIRGAMLDELRRQDDVPRSVRRRQRRIVEAEERLTIALNRAPRHGEVASELEVGEAELWRWKREAARGPNISVDTPVGRGEGGQGRRPSLAEVLPADSSPAVDDRLSRSQEIERLRAEIEGLEERERLVLALYDFEELKLREIAELLEVTESRVSQIRTRAIERLRSRMGDLRDRVAA